MFLLISICRKGSIQVKLIATSTFLDEQSKCFPLHRNKHIIFFGDWGAWAERSYWGSKVTMILPLLSALHWLEASGIRLFLALQKLRPSLFDAHLNFFKNPNKQKKTTKRQKQPNKKNLSLISGAKRIFFPSACIFRCSSFIFL